MIEIRTMLAAFVLCVVGSAQSSAQAPAQAPAQGPARQTTPTPAPAPGTAGLLIPAPQIADLMKAAIASGADPAGAEVGITDRYAIHEVRRAKAGPAAIHQDWIEVYLVMDGGGTLVTGGKLITGPGGNSIDGGVTHVLKKGDVFIIPASTPHMFQQVDPTITYLEVRFASAPR